MGKFTQGKWMVAPYGYDVEAGEFSWKQFLPVAATPRHVVEARANCRLIAESPAMYELLERIAKAEAYSPTEEVWQEEARSIIQRINAKGE